MILVAEDNEINRKVIVQRINLLGYSAEVAVNGREVFERWRGGGALLLTDIHMPEMDGCTLSATVRREESGGNRIPIIAITASVLRDEELRCRAAGMDDYLTKPIRLARLKALLDSWLGADVAANATSQPNAERVPNSDAVNLQVLIDLVGDDPVVIREVLEAFRTSAAKTCDELQQGARTGGGQAVSDATHRLKSGARSIGARRLGEICEELEGGGKRGDWARVSGLLPRFHAELAALLRVLDSR